jgi:adenosylcobinamide-phosphate synthase
VSLVTGALLCWLCIARRSLREHTLPIATALETGDTVFARTRTGYIVSRDTADMDEAQMSRAATESILENGNDAVVAPLFWFLVAGPAGCVAHRVINTLDAMWGYRTDRFEWFGKWAARADDVAAWIPARLTAAGYALAGDTRNAWSAWRRDARRLASPNGGPCMAAGAGALGVRLGGPCHYHGIRHEKVFFGGERDCTAADIRAALGLLDRALLLLVSVAVSCLVLAGMFAGGPA